MYTFYDTSKESVLRNNQSNRVRTKVMSHGDNSDGVDDEDDDDDAKVCYN